MRLEKRIIDVPEKMNRSNTQADQAITLDHELQIKFITAAKPYTIFVSQIKNHDRLHTASKNRFRRQKVRAREHKPEQTLRSGGDGGQ